MGRNFKSGWVTFGTFAGLRLGSDEAHGRQILYKLSGVSFWVNDNGRNWWSFSVDKVTRLQDGVPVEFSTGIANLGKDGNLPFVIISGRKMLLTRSALNNIAFSED
jgi:hypothetical protein